MTRKEMEMTMIHMMKGIEAFVKLFDQNINYITFYNLGKCLDFRAVYQEDGKDDTEILNCHVYEDGSMRIDGVYYNADGSIDFVPMKVRKEVSA